MLTVIVEEREPRAGLASKHATARPRTDLQDRVADALYGRRPARLARERELTETLLGLQQLARERHR